jgi:phosphate uptake regulator
MDTRKVLEMGGGTVLISLPKSWAKRNRISRGSSVAVEEISPRRLLVKPLGSAEKEKREVVVSYPQEKLAHLINDVTGAYLIGSDVIRIEGKQVISREDRERLKSMIGRLVGLEIMDEDSKSMTIQFLLEPSTLDPEKIARRMANITEGMLRDTREGLTGKDQKVLSMIDERDDEVDRLYFLLVRAIRTATIDPEVAERFGLAPVECLDYRVLASFLEGLGDTIAKFSMRSLDESINEQTTAGLAEVIEVLESMEELAMRSFLSGRGGRRSSASVELAAMQARVGELSRKIAQTKGVSTTIVIDLVSLLESIANTFVDISDLGLPTYEFKSELVSAKT